MRTLNFIGIKIRQYIQNINKKPQIQFCGYFLL